MGVRSFFGLTEPEVSDGLGYSTASLEEIMSTYSLVDVVAGQDRPYLVVTSKLAETPTMGEIGSSSPSPFTSWVRKEYNRDLQGIKGLEKYDQMRKSDGAVRSSLRLVKTPVLAARWFVESASDSDLDQEVATFVGRCLWDYTTSTWMQFLTESLLMCDFGYYMFEKVWENREIDGQTRTVLRKLAPRHPMDVKEWQFDAHGGPKAAVFYSSSANTFDEDKTIDIAKLLVFTFDLEAGNIEGISVLRSAYKHWYYKEMLYKIDAIQKERHGIGIPVIKLPINFSQQDRMLADEIGRNLRTNERAHIVLPPNWEILFAKLEGQPVNLMDSIQHHNDMIYENVLATFLKSTSSANDSDQLMFLKATRFIADIVANVVNTYLIKQLVDYNFTVSAYPKLRVRRIGESADWRTLSFAARNLVGSQLLTPDDTLEDYMREEMDLPRWDRETSREVATPQRGARVGLPRQNPKPDVSPGSSGTGEDRSGK